MEFDVRRAENNTPDTSARTAELAAMRAAHREKVAAVRADEDITAEAKTRRLRELERAFRENFDAEAENVTGKLDREIERAYKRAHAPEKPSEYPEEEIAKEMRLQRIREEVRDDLESGTIDALVSYQEAVRLGDRERAEVLARMGPRYLTDHTRRARLRQLVEENLPESRRRAKRDLERLEAEKRSVELGLAMQRHRRRPV